MSDRSGKIITFYSYKGGTGRTMAVSNIAWILASNGHKVLLIDWDLEAPGLHRYLRPFLLDRELSSTPGLIDYVWEASRVSMTPSEGPPKYPALEDYVVGLDWSFRGEGIIDFIPAGLQDDNYAQRVNTFNWDNFYERLGGGKLLEAERNALRASYDYILIDSRTGVSDTSSICTVHMPDALVILFTLNRQSITGAAAIAASVQAQRPEQDFKIFPVPTRVEGTETNKVEAARAFARRVFAPVLRHVQRQSAITDPDQQLDYWKDVETPYRAFYAFEEVPAAFKDEPGSLESVLWPNERIAYWISDRSVTSLQPEKEDLRNQVVDAYALREDDAPRIDWPAPPREGVFKSLRRRIGLRLKKRGWRYATIALAGLLILSTGRLWVISNRLDATLTELNATRSELNATRTELNTTRTELRDAKAEIVRLKDEIKKKEAEIGAKVEELRVANRTISNQSSKIAGLQRQIGALRGQIETLRTRAGLPRPPRR
jgi:MinD-like ATPase involved in chromosome partitioning or flagellar assembly